MSVSVSDLVVSVASSADAADMVGVIHAAFGARPCLDPPSTAGEETPASVEAALRSGGGIYATVEGRPAGSLLISPAGPGLATFQRVSVHPAYQRHGIASAMVEAAKDVAAELGFTAVELLARTELAQTVAFWQHRGFTVVREVGHGLILGRPLPVVTQVPTAARMQQLGADLAELLRPGDLVIASGDLGAGKTTLTQGIGAGLGSEGPVISPTFVLSRVHHSTIGRPTLVHVDAYRLSSAGELDDLDLDASAADSVTVVEWGTGLAEALAEHRLEIDIRRGRLPAESPSDDHLADDHRVVIIRPVGTRWAAELDRLRAAAGG